MTILQELQLIRRNALRLLKLVNSLLDFSQIEAGKTNACFQPTDLSRLTRELAGVFESAIKKASLDFQLDIQPLQDPVYIDQDMWGKIIFNLLSNALKYTFHGGIFLALAQNGHTVQLMVSDTGVGIPEDELSRAFDRFYRIQHVTGRSHEGAGIGLALTEELVKLHGGTISVDSKLHEGSTFTVTIPLGKDHLPASQIQETVSSTSGTRFIDPIFVEEALGWFQEISDSNLEDKPVEDKPVEDKPVEDKPVEDKPVSPLNVKSDMKEGSVLVVEDNVDMRNYLIRILSQHWRLFTATNGQEAVTAALQEKPDLVLTDVMMPIMDGLELIQTLRQNDYTKSIPIILLSARAGEEAQLLGFESGADDYLVKPFSVKELIARVRTHMKLGQLRAKLEEMVAERTLKLQESNEFLMRKLSELQSAEMALRKSERDYQTLADASPIGIARYDVNNRLSFLNKSGCKMIGFTAEQLNGDGWLEAILPDDRTHVREAWRKIKSDGLPSGNVEFRVLLPNKTVIYVVGGLVAERNEQGEVIGYIKTITDITELKQLEEKRFAAVQLAELQQRHRAEDAEVQRHRREEFVDTMCHELRNPLNGIFGNVSLLESNLFKLQALIESTRTEGGKFSEVISEITELIAQDKESIEDINICAKHQKLITNVVLHLSKLEAGKVELNREPADPKKIIYDVIAMLKTESNRKQVKVDLKCDHADIIVVTDPHRLKQVLLNLLSNAIKFTPEEGNVTIELKFPVETENYVCISVEDNGIGMTEEEQSRIFGRFTQATKTTYQKYGGSGLGLTICRSLVNLMGGDIHVESQYGVGSKFTFTIRCDRIDLEKSKASSSCSSSPPKAMVTPENRGEILIVEDNLVNQKVLKRFLEQSGYKCQIANNGQEATIAQEGKRFSLIFMDVEMPVMNGLEATHRIRKSEEEKKEKLPVPIIGLSGNARQEQMNEAKSSGMTDYLTKPYDKDVLLSKIDLYMRPL
jgi:PAS domain S-box-containing protein